MMIPMKLLKFIGCGLWLLATGCATAQDQTNLAPCADSVLRTACQFLQQTPAFSLNAEIWREHVDESGQKIQFSRTVTMDVKRPAGLRLEIISPNTVRGFWYDGKTLTVLDRKHNFYGVTPMPATLDATVDAAHDQFGIDLPLIDLALSDPYKNATAQVTGGKYFGIAPVLGVLCHHLAFTQDNLDWQVWIEDGPQPLIRKFVITQKNEPGAPEFTALITHWNVSDRVDDSDFVFSQPKGAAKVEMQEAGNSK